ncbi:MAG: ComF family protein [Fibrobacter sp.]|nr:ComF family protein [Fibrobacter sp.]
MANIISYCMEAVADYLSPKLCVNCGTAIKLQSKSKFLCTTCFDWLKNCGNGYYNINGTHSLYPLNDVVRSLMHGLKYHGMTDIAIEMINVLPWEDTSFMGWGNKINIVPVPVNSARLRERGYNQAECIARAMQKKWGGRLFLGVLKRKKYNVSQTRLGAEERAWNAAGAFTARPPLPAEILLVDDVYTTGATTEACRYALMRAGAEKVEVLTMAYKLTDDGSSDWRKDWDYFKNKKVP